MYHINKHANVEARRGERDAKFLKGVTNRMGNVGSPDFEKTKSTRIYK